MLKTGLWDLDNGEHNKVFMLSIITFKRVIISSGWLNFKRWLKKPMVTAIKLEHKALDKITICVTTIQV